MVTYCVSKIIPTCSPVIGQFFDTMIVVASIDKMWLETVLSHLKTSTISKTMWVYQRRTFRYSYEAYEAFFANSRFGIENCLLCLSSYNNSPISDKAPDYMSQAG